MCHPFPDLPGFCVFPAGSFSTFFLETARCALPPANHLERRGAEGTKGTTGFFSISPQIDESSVPRRNRGGGASFVDPEIVATFEACPPHTRFDQRPSPSSRSTFPATDACRWKDAAHAPKASPTAPVFRSWGGPNGRHGPSALFPAGRQAPLSADRPLLHHPVHIQFHVVGMAGIGPYDDEILPFIRSDGANRDEIP